MRTLTLIVLLCGFVTAARPAFAQSNTPPEPVVVVSGEGLVKAAPDRAFVTIGAESRSKRPKDAQAQNAVAMTTVQQSLLAAGLPKDAIRTLSYDLQLESDWVNGRQVVRGYVARNLIEVRLDDIARVGEVLDIAVTGGATSVHGVRFDLKQRAQLERDALKMATADARGRAEAAASGAGAAIGRVIRIEEPVVRSYPQPMQMMEMGRAAVGDATMQVPVIAGEIEIRASVVLTATLKN